MTYRPRTDGSLAVTFTASFALFGFILGFNFGNGSFGGSDAMASAGSAFSPNFHTACANDFATLSRPDPKTGPRNSQLAIWALEARGKTAAAAELKQEAASALQSAKVISYDEIADRDATSLTFLEMEGGLRGVWKYADNDNEYTTLREIRKEITAYNFDQMIGAGLVPITVHRTFLGRRGVVQLFVRDVDAAEFTYNPNSLKLFDYLIAHADRTELNHLTHRGRTIAIDNESTFTSGRLNLTVPRFDQFVLDTLKKVDEAGGTPASKSKAISEIAPTLINKDAIDKLRNTTDAQWKKGLTGINKEELAAFLERKNQALKAIDLATEKLGPDLFPAGRFSGLVRNQWGPETQFLRSMGPRLPEGELKTKALRVQRILEGHATSGRPIAEDQIDFIDRVLTEIEWFEAEAQNRR